MQGRIIQQKQVVVVVGTLVAMEGLLQTEALEELLMPSRVQLSHQIQ